MIEDLTKRVTRLEERFDDLDKSFCKVLEKIEELDLNLNKKMQILLSRFTDIINKLTFLDELAKSKSRIDALQSMYRNLNNRLDNYNTDLFDLKNKVNEIEEKNVNETLDKTQKQFLYTKDEKVD